VPLKIVPRATLGTRAVGCRRLCYRLTVRVLLLSYNNSQGYLWGARWRND